MKQPELKYLDKRTVRRNIKQGFLKEDEHDKFLKGLPDEAENAVPVSFEELDAAELHREEEMDDEELIEDDLPPETPSKDE
ncbi:MAG: hypothetical protein HY541_06150 [Deltaproteobacteria bacterium]|nr:hypothetical protein [Deltaproteobacteria bacterium]